MTPDKLILIELLGSIRQLSQFVEEDRRPEFNRKPLFSSNNDQIEGIIFDKCKNYSNYTIQKDSKYLQLITFSIQKCANKSLGSFAAVSYSFGGCQHQFLHFNSMPKEP